MSVLLKCARLL